MYTPNSTALQTKVIRQGGISRLVCISTHQTTPRNTLITQCGVQWAAIYALGDSCEVAKHTLQLRLGWQLQLCHQKIPKAGAGCYRKSYVGSRHAPRILLARWTEPGTAAVQRSTAPSA